MKGDFIVLICIFLVSNDVEDPLKYLLTICMSSIEKYLMYTENYNIDEIT